MSLSLPATCHDVHPLLPDVRLPTDWAGMSRIDGLDDELTITAWHGMPVQALDVQAEGPPMLCIAVFLDGEADMSIDGGPPLHATRGWRSFRRVSNACGGAFACQAGSGCA